MPRKIGAIKITMISDEGENPVGQSLVFALSEPNKFHVVILQPFGIALA